MFGSSGHRLQYSCMSHFDLVHLLRQFRYNSERFLPPGHFGKVLAASAAFKDNRWHIV
jgi:hypothetical protein